MIVLAIDPGLEGGAVLLPARGRQALAAWHWQRVARGFRVTTRARELTAEATVQTLHHVSHRLWGEVKQARRPFALVVEGLYQPPPPAGQPTAEELKAYGGQCVRVMTLAEATAKLYGPLEPRAERLYRPRAAQWRPPVLRCSPATPGTEAKRFAVEMMTALLPAIEGLGELAHVSHVAEAGCMALWGAAELRHDNAPQGVGGVRG